MPYDVIEISLNEFEAFFVDGLENRTARRRLFENYLLFLAQLKTIIEPPFYQWIDGSFVTLKEYPKDLDVLTFIPIDTVNSKIYELIWLKADSRLDLDIDANFVATCEPGHVDFENAHETKRYWQRLFGGSSALTSETQQTKGIIQVIIRS